MTRLFIEQPLALPGSDKKAKDYDHRQPADPPTLPSVWQRSKIQWYFLTFSGQRFAILAMFLCDLRLLDIN